MDKGIFAVNKPKGITSHDVVDIVRKKTSERRVGHGGTLDPMAQGVLVIAVGRENTKKLNEFVKGEKEYEAEITLGATSSTDDVEGEIVYKNIEHEPTEDEVRKNLNIFVGKIQQTPPIYSSIKIKGKPAHRRVRLGEKVKIGPRTVDIKGIELLSYDYPVLKLKVTTGPGVYIRSLARDVGEKLKTGGYLTALTRTRVGKFGLGKAITLHKG